MSQPKEKQTATQKDAKTVKKPTEGYNGGLYSFEQQIFCMSWATSLSFNLTGSAKKIENETKTRLLNVLENEKVQELIGIWDLVWGPAVYADSYFGDKKMLNAMYVVVPRLQPEQAIVAIAGTNGSSLMDWVVEDFSVHEVVPWPYGTSPLEPHISTGIAFGLDKLVTMKGAASKGQQLMTCRQFLASQAFEKIMVTGHSLGGALSPCYALYLEETRSQWDASGKAAISILATAGQTPGDAGFSTYYDGRLSEATSRKWNAMDIVPHAFSTNLLAEIPDLYEPELSSDLIGKLVAWVERQTTANDYKQVMPGEESFPSKFYSLDDLLGKHDAVREDIEGMRNMMERALKGYERQVGFSVTPGASAGEEIADAIAFVVQALIQHTVGYIAYFDTGAFNQLMAAINQNTGSIVSNHTEAAGRIKDALVALRRPVLLDMGARPADEVEELRLGRGPLLGEILSHIGEETAGGAMEGAHSVIFLVEDNG